MAYANEKPYEPEVKAASPVRSDSSFAEAQQEPRRDDGLLGRLTRWEQALDAKLGVESEAIERKLPEDKRPASTWEQLNMFFLWASGTMNLSCFSTGFIGWELGLTLRQCVTVTICTSLLGAMATGFCATFGPPTGLRQISVSRYAFGWYCNKVIALLNTIIQIGWASVSCITGGLALTAVADGRISLVIGIVILALVSTAVSFVGLRAVLVWERYAWIVFFIIFLILFGMTGSYTDNSTPSTLSGNDESSAVLTLIAIMYGSSASWQTMASDYYAHYPINTSRVKVFIMTSLGIAIPTSIGMTSGIVAAFALNNRSDWNVTYTNEGLGFLVQDIIHPLGFAKFILTLLVLGGINVNIISIYSSALSCQQFARPFARIPRFLWVLACLAVILGLAVGGRENLNAYLQNFLSLLGYVSTQYFVILFSEHVFFRKMNFDNYDLTAWNDKDRLPLGLAAGVAFGIGIIAWVMGMSQTWYLGPIAKLIGTGGDVANELTLVVTAVFFIPLRAIELRMIGR